MFDEETGTSAKVSSLTLHEELGAIDYIFADKWNSSHAQWQEFVMMRPHQMRSPSYKMIFTQLLRELKA
jgi:hypothetical protein